MSLSFVSGGASSSITAGGAEAIAINETTRVVTIPAGVVSSYFNAVSQRDKKKNIQEADFSAIDLLQAVEVVTYQYKDETGEYLHTGFIAEDAPPSLTGCHHDGMSMSDVCGVLIKAVQELAAANELLQAQVERIGLPWYRKLFRRRG